MQEERLSFNISSGIGVISRNRTISQGLFAPYKQQAHDFNHLLQNQMTRELYNQFKVLEDRAVFCLKVKDKSLEEMTRRSVEMENSLRKALAEAEFWRKSSEQKTALCQDLAARLLKAKRRENPTNTLAEKNFAEDEESSIGENSDNVLDTARTRRCKRRRL